MNLVYNRNRDTPQAVSHKVTNFKQSKHISPPSAPAQVAFSVQDTSKHTRYLIEHSLSIIEKHEEISNFLDNAYKEYEKWINETEYRTAKLAIHYKKRYQPTDFTPLNSKPSLHNVGWHHVTETVTTDPATHHGGKGKTT